MCQGIAIPPLILIVCKNVRACRDDIVQDLQEALGCPVGYRELQHIEACVCLRQATPELICVPFM